MPREEIQRSQPRFWSKSLFNRSLDLFLLRLILFTFLIAVTNNFRVKGLIRAHGFTGFIVYCGREGMAEHSNSYHGGKGTRERERERERNRFRNRNRKKIDRSPGQGTAFHDTPQ
jgi:hypothetical protein